jgi:hypothetical protein
MTYTREMLEKMSDTEVNLELAKLLYSDQAQDCIVFGFNYEDWGVIMPLAVEYDVFLDNGAVINECHKKYVAYSSLIYNYSEIVCASYYFSDDSPQRAIACCLLTMEVK